MSIKNQYRPQSVTHPGFILEEKLAEIGMSKKEFAVRTQKPEKTISQVVNQISSITPDMAVLFENVLKIPASFWLKLQIKHDEAVAREKVVNICDASEAWARRLPYAHIAKDGWVPPTRKVEEKVRNALNFFGISSYKAWEDIYLKQELKVAFRISLAHMKEPEAISVWLRMGELQAAEKQVAEYCPNSFVDALEKAKHLMFKHPSDFFSQLEKLCADSGVKLVYTPCLPKAPISGCTRWIDGTPVMQLSGRYKTNDKFWFTFFHEAGHILKHGKKDIFLEDTSNGHDTDKEREADEFAAEMLLPKAQEEEILKYLDFSIPKIKFWSRKFNVHPAIIVGRLLHNKTITYPAPNGLHNFFVPIELKDN